MDALLSWNDNTFNTRRIKSQGRSPTLDSHESLSSDSESLGPDNEILFLEESVKPLTCHVDILDPEKILYPFDYVALSQVTY